MKKLFSSDYLVCSQTHFSIIKGISIFIIVLVHLCNRYLNFGYLSPLAGAAVAVFLLCSGYGLSESFLSKGNLKAFWENKIIKIWLPSFLKLSVVALVSLSGFMAWLTEYPLFLYGWYLQVLFGEYFVFWLLFSAFKSKKIRLIGLFGFSIVAFFLIRSQLYAEQLFCFPLGVMFSQMNMKEKMEQWDWKGKLALFFACGFIAAASFFLRNRFNNYILFNLIWMLCKVSLAILVCFVPYYMRKLRIFGVFIPLGTYSYMLYLTNNDILALLDGGAQWYRVAVVLLILVIVAIIFKYVCDKLAEFYCKVIRKTKSDAAPR